MFKFGFFTKNYFEMYYPGVWERMKTTPYTRENFLPYEKREEEMIIEYWYKTRTEDGHTRCHMAKLAGGLILEKSEDTRPQGMYAHGLYPFLVEPLYRLDGLPIGLGSVSYTHLKKTPRFESRGGR